MNVLIGIISIILCFTMVVLLEKIFKKEGLYAWIVIAVIVANIMACKQVNFFGYATSLGSVLFASSFLATDILTIKYDKKSAKKAVVLGLVSIILFNIIMQLTIAYIPNDLDFVNDSIKTLFNFSGRISIASIIMYFVSNMADVYLFDKLRKKFPNKLWLSNNVSTILCNCTENFLFGILAFAGVFPLATILQMQILGCIIETIIALCDTPFLYLSRKLK